MSPPGPSPSSRLIAQAFKPARRVRVTAQCLLAFTLLNSLYRVSLARGGDTMLISMRRRAKQSAAAVVADDRGAPNGEDQTDV